MAAVAHDEIGDWIFFNGIYEEDLLSAITSWLIPRLVPDHRQTVALDVGANIGNHAVAFAPYFESVYAFEPNPIALHLLEANILLNGLRNVEVFPVGLSDQDAVLDYEAVDGNLGAGHFVSREPSAAAEALLPEVKVGDRLLKTHSGDRPRIGLVKVDVEGMEPAVLRGLQDTLRRDRPVVLFEALDTAAARDTAEVLVSCGYRSFCSVDRLPSGYSWIVAKALSRLLRGADLYLSPVDFAQERPYRLVVATVQPLSLDLP
jgi:FkbM family methyltransferase